ncbi:MAG: hypothetical protein JXB85_00625 [Anaerolineales bacterium]|nr:hypothetical protein [Anaerolineales bacterium]
MTLPALLFGILLSSAYGTAFHFWKGGSLRRLFIYVILAWVGFWLGHLIAEMAGWHFAAVGPLNAGLATLGSVILLFVGEWLGRVEITRN